MSNVQGGTQAERENLLEGRSEVLSDDGEHQDHAGDMELVKLRQQPATGSGYVENVNAAVSSESDEGSNTELQALWDKNTSLLEAIARHNNTEVKRLLEEGANPNATCRIPLTSACHVAAFSNEEALRMLLEAGAETKRFDCMGITPLHYAAWTNAPRKIAMLLKFPKDLTDAVTKVKRNLTPELESEIQEIGARVQDLVNATGGTIFPSPFDSVLPEKWMTNEDTRDFGYFPLLVTGSAALHAATEVAHCRCVRLLLLAGADPSLADESGSTPLDVAGLSSSPDYVKSYEETLYLLRKYGGNLSNANRLVLETALRHRSIDALELLLDAGAPINHRNPEGETAMNLCVTEKLKEHLNVLVNFSSPDMDYRAVDVTDATDSTVLHGAAQHCWEDGVAVALAAGADITIQNTSGDTALHLAAKAGSYDIVKKILEYDTNSQFKCNIENNVGESPFSNAIVSGNADIVQLMLDQDNDLRDYLDRKVGLLSPLEFAVEKNYPKLFKLILNEQNEALDRSEAFRMVNVIAKHNRLDMFKEFETNNFMQYPVKEIISKNFTLHEAIVNGSRNIIIALLVKGADLSQRNGKDQTALNLLMYHITKPTEFLTEAFDKYFKIDGNIYDKDCKITIDYSVLKPVNIYAKSGQEAPDEERGQEAPDEERGQEAPDEERGQEAPDEESGQAAPANPKAEDMKVLLSLIETGNVYNQNSLLAHPLIESFLYLKWKTFSKFIYLIILTYVLFLMSINTYVGSVYYYRDHNLTEKDVTCFFQPILWRFSSFVTLIIIFLLEISFVTTYKQKWYLEKSFWVKALVTLGGLIMICVPMDVLQDDIFRGIAAVTALMSWLNLMVYLSWTPTLGFYMQMYGKVSIKVMKVMLTFSFAVVGFSISFLILLRGEKPFNDPIASLWKTIVMMTSEFEYENLMDKTSLTSLTVLRTIFLLFLICVSVVLMNLMLGFGITDIQELSHDGKLRRLIKQVDCISMLEKLFQQPLFKNKWTKIAKIPFTVEVTRDSSMFNREMKEIIMNKAQSILEQEKKKAADVSMKAKLDDIFDLIKKQPDLPEKKLMELIEKTVERSVNRVLETSAVKVKEAGDASSNVERII